MDDGTVGLDQRRFARLVRRHRVLIAACVVIGLLAAAALAISGGKTYVASTQLRVDSPLTLNDLLSTNTTTRATVTVSDQVAVLKSDAVRSRVRQQLGGKGKYSANFASAANGDVVAITVTARKSSVAHDAAAAYTTAYLDILAEQNRPLFDAAVRQLSASINDANRQVQTLNQTLASATSSSSLDSVRAQVSSNQMQLLQRRTDLQRQLDQVELARSVSPSGSAAVVSAPSTVSGSGPLKKTLVGGVLGLLVGLVLASVREGRSGRIVDASDVADLGLEVVARVSAPIPRRIRTAAAAAVAAGDDGKAYRGAAVVLAPPHGANVPRRWLVTAAESDGNASAVLAGRLARQVAQLGRSVVMIDCAVEQGRGQAAAADKPVGLSEVLRGGTPLERALRKDASSGVTLLSAGQVLSSLVEPLASPQFAQVLEQLSSRFSVVIVTGVPIGRSADADLLAPLADVIVLAVESGVTRKRALAEALDRLAGVVPDGRLVGVLVGDRRGAGTSGGDGHKEAVQPVASRERRPAMGGLVPQRVLPSKG